MTNQKHALEPRPDPPKRSLTGPVFWLVSMLSGVRFFSRFPLPSLFAADDPGNPPAFGAIVRLLACASLVIALPSALALLVLTQLNLPPLAIATLTVLTAILSTGALHEDGLGDVADGFGGGQTPQQKLDIMKDSRLGTYGVIALMGSLLVRVAALSQLVAVAPEQAALFWLACCVLSRSIAILPWVILPAARPSGVAGNLAKPSLTDFATGLGIAAALAFLVSGSFLILAAGSAAFAAAFALARLARSQIGGFTGDLIGAAEQLCQGLILLVLAALFGSLMS